MPSHSDFYKGLDLDLILCVFLQELWFIFTNLITNDYSILFAKLSECIDNGKPNMTVYFWVLSFLSPVG